MPFPQIMKFHTKLRLLSKKVDFSSNLHFLQKKCWFHAKVELIEIQAPKSLEYHWLNNVVSQVRSSYILNEISQRSETDCVKIFILRCASAPRTKNIIPHPRSIQNRTEPRATGTLYAGHLAGGAKCYIYHKKYHELTIVTGYQLLHWKSWLLSKSTIIGWLVPSWQYMQY